MAQANFLEPQVSVGPNPRTLSLVLVSARSKRLRSRSTTTAPRRSVNSIEADSGSAK